MAIGHLRALILLHRTFRHLPLPQRAHILGRYLSAPFLRTLDLIPAGARVLDIGAGHGLLARLAVEAGAAGVVGVDPDVRKVLYGCAHGEVRLVAGYDDCVRGAFDVVTMYDVVPRVAEEQRDGIFASAYERLRSGGLFIVKDLDPSSRFKAWWNRTQERFSDRLALSAGQYSEPESRDRIAGRMARAGFADFQWKRIDFGYPHAHIVYTARKP